MDDKGSPSFREHPTAFYCVAQRRTAAADERNIAPLPQKADGVNRLNNRQKAMSSAFAVSVAGRWATINSIKALGYPCRNAL
ncbi:hypothetical protein M5585_19335 [Serratia ureilytica]